MRVGPLQNILDDAVSSFFKGFDFNEPHGEAAIYSPDSWAWKTYKNPITTFIGGVSAVIMQLSEPRVRHGVWSHSTFKTSAEPRMKRTNLAAMATIFGPQSATERLITRVNRMHANISGVTECGQTYRADDPELLRWVEETVAHGMVSAYSTHVREITAEEIARDLESRKRSATLFGVQQISENEEQRAEYFKAVLPCLEANPVIFEFLDIVNTAELLPSALRPFQRLIVRAAVDNVPQDIRDVIQMDERYGLRSYERALVNFACALGDRIQSDAHPAVLACKRLGLPADYLYDAQAAPQIRSQALAPLHQERKHTLG